MPRRPAARRRGSHTPRRLGGSRCSVSPDLIMVLNYGTIKKHDRIRTVSLQALAHTTTDRLHIPASGGRVRGAVETRRRQRVITIPRIPDGIQGTPRGAAGIPAHPQGCSTRWTAAANGSTSSTTKNTKGGHHEQRKQTGTSSRTNTPSNTSPSSETIRPQRAITMDDIERHLRRPPPRRPAPPEGRRSLQGIPRPFMDARMRAQAEREHIGKSALIRKAWHAT